MNVVKSGVGGLEAGQWATRDLVGGNLTWPTPPYKSRYWCNIKHTHTLTRFTRRAQESNSHT
jgi:hypothetical protein